MRDTVKFVQTGIRMIAHRGLSALECENTAAAFVAAGNRSHWGIETDVHRTADGAFVVVHDDDTLRVSGVKLHVEQTDLGTLRRLRLMDKDGRAREDLCIPTLEEYVRICKAYEKISVLELKNRLDAEDIARIVEIIRAEGWLEQTVFISFELDNLLDLRRMLPEQPVQYLVEAIKPELLPTLVEHRLDLDAYYRALTGEFVQEYHKAGVKVNVWTVDRLEDAARMAEFGVDYVTSNILE